MKRAEDLDVAGRTVLVRADLNVPMDGAAITDDGRIRASLPTIRDLLARGASVIVCAHLGRPKGDDYAARAAGGPSLRPVADRLAELLGQPVTLAADVAGESARTIAATMAAGEVALLENVRFEPAETSKDDEVRGELAGRLAALADVYVGDGFGAMHRKHASVYDTPLLLPHAAGQLVLAEVAVLRQLTTSPARPYVVVLGGAKVSDKLAVIGNLVGGGRPAAHRGRDGVHVPGRPGAPDRRFDPPGRADPAGHRGARRRGQGRCRGGAAGGPRGGRPVRRRRASPRSCPARTSRTAGWGSTSGPPPASCSRRKLADAKTVFWNGPPGVFEFPAFAAGTLAVAEAISRVAGLTVVGGGDSAAAVRHLNLPADAFTHISTGGGASLEYLEGRDLPGLAALAAGT